MPPPPLLSDPPAPHASSISSSPSPSSSPSSSRSLSHDAPVSSPDPSVRRLPSPAASFSLLSWFVEHTSTPVRSLIAGGVAGCVAKTATAPLDRVKILFQGSNPNFHRFTTQWSGPFQAVWWIYRQDGLLACYKGHAATLARIFPYAALNYYCFEHYKRWIMRYTRTHRIDGAAQQAAISVVAGGMAGTTSVFFTYPLDYVHSRITYQVKIARYRGIVQTIRSTLQEGVQQAKAERMAHGAAKEDITDPAGTARATAGKAARSDVKLPLPHLVYGLRKLYTGFGTTVLGIIPYAGVSFATYDTLKRLTLPYYPDGHVPIVIRLVWGACAGAAAQTASYPLDVIRRRMQLFGLSSTLPHYRNTWDAAKSIIRKEGVRGLFVGLSINYIKGQRRSASTTSHFLTLLPSFSCPRSHPCSVSFICAHVVAPAHAISFLTYEHMKRVLKVDGH